MFSFNDKISIRQLQILLILDIFGTGIIVLPRYAAKFANQDAWIIVILATILALISMYIITTLCSIFPKKNFYQYTSKILGKPFGIILTLCFILKLILNISLQLRFFAEIVKQVMLNNTPFSILFISILFVSAFVASKGYETRARLGEILVFVVFIPLIIVFIIASVDIDFSNIMPVMTTKKEDILKGTIYIFSSFTGIELALLVFPNIRNYKKVKKALLQSVTIIGIIMVVITIVTIGRFGHEEIKFQMWPIISMMDTIDIPGSFLERQEALIMSFWIISVFFIVNAGLFFSSIMAKSLIKKGKHIYYIIFFTIMTFFISFFPKNIIDTCNLIDIVFFTLDIFYMFLLPLILLIIAKLRRIIENEKI